MGDLPRPKGTCEAANKGLQLLKVKDKKLKRILVKLITVCAVSRLSK